MNIATQDQVLRAVRSRLVSALGLPESRVYLVSEPVFAEAMDFAVQISPIASGATSEMNRTGLGFVTERFAVTTFVRSVSDNSVKQNRQLAGIDRGVLSRQSDVRKALIQHELDGLLQVAIRFVSSGPVRLEPRSESYLSATDIFVCSYAIPWPVAGKFRYGWKATQPTWADLAAYENSYVNSTRYTVSPTRPSTGGGIAASEYLWFAFPDELHSLGISIRNAAGLEPFYRTGFTPPSGPAIGTIVQDGITYHLYRRAWPTVSTSLVYTVSAG